MPAQHGTGKEEETTQTSETGTTGRSIFVLEIIGIAYHHIYIVAREAHHGRQPIITLRHTVGPYDRHPRSPCGTNAKGISQQPAVDVPTALRHVRPAQMGKLLLQAFQGIGGEHGGVGIGRSGIHHDDLEAGMRLPQDIGQVFLQHGTIAFAHHHHANFGNIREGTSASAPHIVGLRLLQRALFVGKRLF